MRLWQFLSRQGVGSRQQILLRYPELGVTRNGQPLSPLALLASGDEIRWLDSTVRVAVYSPSHVTTDGVACPLWLWHKPIGVDCNVRVGQLDSVWARLQQQPQLLHPVGRLDKDSHGLMLLSSDGNITHALMHPTKAIEKTYRVRVRGTVTPDALQQLAQGPSYHVGPKHIQPQPCRVQQLAATDDGDVLELKLTEGKHRQIRYMCRALGWTVLDLQRTAIGPIKLGALPLDAIVPLDAPTWRTLQQLLQQLGSSSC